MRTGDGAVKILSVATTTPSIPPAKSTARQICENVRTTIWPSAGGTPPTRWVSATANIELPYSSPLDAQVFMTMIPMPATPARPWLGRCTIQGWATTEVGALAELAEQLAALQLPVPAAIAATAAALALTTSKTPWEQRPLDSRGGKPRRFRHQFRDKRTGKVVRIYPETMKRHADPNCRCEYCTLADATPTTSTEESTAE